MWSSKSNDAPLLNPGQTPSREVRQDLASAWDTVTKTKAALRHIENRLEAVPTSNAVLDSVMDTKKTLSSAARKVSRKDGRYLEDSAGSVPMVKSGSRSKSRREKSSRSPLRATTLESNIKKSSRVEFRDPLTSYRDLDSRVPPYLTASQLEAQRLLIDLNSNEVRGKEEESSRIIYERDKRNFHCLDDDSTRTTAVDDTVVKYLNDHSALDALHNSETLYKAVSRGPLGQKDADLGARGSCANPGYESDFKNDRPSEPSQLSSPSSTPESVMQKLEIMRKKQHDDKLEKLKERIRKQREQSEESAERERLLNFSEHTLGFSVDTATPTTKVRKVTAGPPAPMYKGFNPMETKIRTPDGKVWREDEFRSITRDLYQDFPLQLGESSKMKDIASDKTKEKKTTKPVRKVQKITRSLSPDIKPSSHLINTASWREGQKLVKMVLGPTPKVMKDIEGVSNERAGRDRKARAGHNTRAESDTRREVAGTSRPRSSERPRPRQQPEVDHKKEEEPSAMDAMNTHVLPAEVRGILDDLQLEAPNHDQDGRVEAVQNPSVSRPASRSTSPTKRKQDKGNSSAETQLKRLRHYDSEEVRQYIMRQQVERKKKQSEEKKAQKEAMEQRNKRLQELYRKQKEAFMKPRTEPMCQKRLQETFSKFVSEQAKLEEMAHHQPALEDKQPIYQPSGESDKENKGQERPLSASSSSDMSLSEPPQPLGRVDGLESSWMPADRLSPAALSAHPHSGGNFFSHLLKLDCRGLLQREYESPARKKETSFKGKHSSVQFPSSTVLSDYSTGSQKPTGQYKSKLDRIEALKATAASLSNRLESEAKKLAGAAINYGAPHTSEHDVLQPAREDEQWAKPISPPVRDEGENEFSATMRRILGASVGHTIYDDRLPGVGNLYEYKKPHEQPRPESAGLEMEARTLGMDRRQGVSWEHTYKRSLETVEQNIQKLSRERKHLNDSHNSSAGSISEGPLPSEASLSEDESAYASRDPVKLSERLREREFCAGEVIPSRPIAEFQKEAEKYQPFQLQSEGRKSRAPWEELAKGSPHSVINIFTKNYQIYGKGGLQEGSDTNSPVLRSQGSAANSEEQAAYEDDFHSSQGSTSIGKKLPSHQSTASSPSSIQEELLSRKSYDVRPGELSPRSSGQRSTASSRSSASSKRRLKLDVGEAAVSVRYSPVDESSRAPAHFSDKCSQEGKRSCLGQGLAVELEDIQDKESTLDDASIHSMLSLSAEVTSVCPKSLPDDQAAGGDRTRQPTTSALSPSSVSTSYRSPFTDGNVGAARPAVSTTAGAMRCSPGSLQQRITAELTYLDAIEVSVRQLTDIEKTRGIALAQQESVSLAQILKAQQQRHEHELAVLKLNAEQELLATQRHLEESRHKAAQAHVESLQHFAQTRQEMLHESTNKMMTQQTEAVRLTADAARQIKEMTELACAQMGAGAGTVATASLRVATAVPVTALLDQQRLQNSDFMKQLRARAEPDRRKDSSPPFGDKLLESKVQYSASIDSLSESSRSKHHNRSSGSSRQDSPSLPSDRGSERRASHQEEKGDNSSVEEEVHTAADDSIQSGSMASVPDDKDSVSVATEYSLKFDESMTEDEIEEKSFRSLLPSESHRRFNMEKKRSRQVDSDEDATRDKSSLTAVKHELSMPFSGGQDSFSKFTMEMVRQYMKEEEMRAQHQVSLLKLREKALKEKTKAELAWLEHQRKRLRDKGEDDKMPPIRKRQRGLLLRLQQEQAEIKRLQEANKAARKERQLILKQQEEIQRMRQTTIKLQEKLKSAGEGKLELRSAEPMEEDSISKQSPPSSHFHSDVESRSPSPVSASGSETSSIMQKLKKMRSHMDEKFLTKREQKLMHRRRHAEELLEWKHRLDAEETEIRRMEKQALAAWDKELLRQKAAQRESSERSPGSKDTASEEECPAPSSSHFNSDSSIPEEVTSPPAQSVESASVTQRKTSSHERSAFIQETYSQEFESVVTPSTQSPPLKVSATGSKQDGQKSSSSLSVEISPPGKTSKPSGSWSDESVSMTYSETASDQSDIESRIRALKAELRKRKSIVDQLKKEQRKRQKERLKAQEASLLKQLESYDEFIKKTQAELSKDLELSTSTKPQIKTPSSSAEKPNIKPHPLQRSESIKSWKSLTESEKSRASLGSATDQESRSLSVASRRSKLHLSELRSASLNKSGVSDIQTDESSQSPSPVSKSLRSVLEFAEGLDNVSLSLLQIGATECSRLPDVSSIRPDDGSGDESVVSSHRSGQDDIQEELQTIKSEESEADEFHVPSQQSNESEPLLNLIDVKSHTPELLETLTQRSSTSLEDKVQSHTVNSVEQNVGDLQEGVYSLGKEGSADEEDGASDHSVSSVKSVKSSKSDASAKSIKSDGSTVNKGSNRNDPHPQEVSALSSRKEPTYSEDFESTPRKKASEEHTKTCVESSNSESLAAFSSRKEMGEHSIEPPWQFLCDQPKQEEVNEKEGRCQSVSSSIDSDAEISEHLSEKSFTGSGHSERLWELKSPTERSKNEERSDVGTKDHVPVLSPSPEHTSIAMPFETDELPMFQIGDRVLVSSVQPGTLHFKGQTRFANGFWAGVELDKPEGSNNGMYDGIVYFTCKDKHGIFAPPHKISHLPEGYEELIDTTEDDEESLFESKLNQYREAFSQEKDTQYHSKDEIQQGENEPKDSQTGEIPAGKVDLNLSVSRNDAQYASIQYPDSNIIDLGHIINESAKAVESFVCDQNLEEILPENTPKDQLENLTKENFNPPDGSAEPATDLLSTDMVDNFFTKVSMVSSNDAIREKEVSPAGHEVSSTPLLDLLTREKEQLEAQLRASHFGPVSEEIFEETEEVQAEEEPEDNKTKASSLADNLLSFFVKETVKQLQDIKKSRNGKIHLTNEELNVELADESTLWAPAYHVEVQDAVALQLQSLVGMDSDDDREEPLSPDLCARPGSPVFGTSGQEELAKRLAELEWSRELLDDLGDEQDWFDEDFGLSSRKVPQPEPNQQPLQPAEVQKAVPQKVREEPYFAVPHNAEEVEKMVHAAAEELWKWQELGQSLQDMHIPGDYFVNCKGQDIESVSKQVYYEAMFNLTREIFSEIFAEDPNATQPPWMKSSRMSSSYFRRVRNLQDMDEVKTFISNEVLKLFGFRREQNNKTDWQKMMKFGRKKRDRVDHILVQELHEEEAQWVNYDEDELCVKMQLADGIFEALIKDTIDVLNQIQEKRSKLVAS